MNFPFLVNSITFEFKKKIIYEMFSKYSNFNILSSSSEWYDICNGIGNLNVDNHTVFAYLNANHLLTHGDILDILEIHESLIIDINIDLFDEHDSNITHSLSNLLDLRINKIINLNNTLADKGYSIKNISPYNFFATGDNYNNIFRYMKFGSLNFERLLSWINFDYTFGEFCCVFEDLFINNMPFELSSSFLILIENQKISNDILKDIKDRQQSFFNKSVSDIVNEKSINIRDLNDFFLVYSEKNVRVRYLIFTLLMFVFQVSPNYDISDVFPKHEFEWLYDMIQKHSIDQNIYNVSKSWANDKNNVIYKEMDMQHVLHYIINKNVMIDFFNQKNKNR